MMLLEVSEISKKIEDGFALHDINFTQKKYQKIAVAGETGSGKSTLLKIVAGLEQPDGGEVKFENSNVIGPSDNLVPGHPKIAYLSQTFELPKFLRVEQVLTYANKISPKAASTLYKVCQIDHLLKRKTDQLSGGEKQRIAIARLLTGLPKLLLLDEPFSHLDMVHKATLKTVINDIGHKLKITCMLVSHDPGDILSWADKIIVMKDGGIVQKGTPAELYNKPVNEYVAGLFGNYCLLKEAAAKVLGKKSLGKGTKGKNIFVRPENLRLTVAGKKSLKGKIETVNYYGSFYEVNVACSKGVLTVRTSHNNIAEGDIVHVSMLPGELWYL
jgi:iron(III) transport system ATP-binding protein